MTIDTIRTPATQYRPESARLSTVLPGAGSVTIDVFGPVTALPGDLFPSQGPKVNWPGIGAVSPDDAAGFAELLAEAARVAATLTGAVAA